MSMIFGMIEVLQSNLSAEIDVDVDEKEKVLDFHLIF